MDNIISKLEYILEERKTEDANTSYVASLYAKGDDAILKKIAEEAAEVIMATKENNAEHIIYEATDLYFHLLVLLAHKNIKIEEIYNELERRFGLSGIIEKQQRKEK